VAPRTTCLSRTFWTLETLSHYRHLTPDDTLRVPRPSLSLNTTKRNFQERRFLTNSLLIASETDLYSGVQIMKDLPTHHNVSQRATTSSTRIINSRLHQPLPPSPPWNAQHCATPIFHHPPEDNGHVIEERQRFYSSRDIGSQNSRSRAAVS
jgi:hypothetical protein